MPAPTKSLRPKMRPKKIEDEAMLEEGSTQHPSGLNMDERSDGGAVERGNRASQRRAKEGSTADTQKFMGGGMVKQGYMDGGEVRAGDVRDNPKRGKCY